MFCGRKSNNRINHLHERALRIVYNDNQSSFENFLRKDRSVSIHHRNICSFAIEIYKVKNNVSTPIMSELFEKRNLNSNIRSQADFSLHSVNTFAGNILQEKCGALLLLKLKMPQVLKNSRLKLKVGDLKIVHVGCV